MAEITGAKITTRTDYNASKFSTREDNENKHFLDIEMPLPGGKASYEIPIEKDVLESLEFAMTLVNKTKKK